MKKILLINIMVIGLISLLKGQETTNLDFYVGTWKYTNSTTNEEFTIKLKNSNDTLTFNTMQYYIGCIVGTYEYKKNGVIVLSCMNKYDMNLSPICMPVYASNGAINTTPNPNELYMFVIDYGVNKTTFSNSLTIVSATNPKQIRWILKNDEGEYEASECPPEEFSIPVDVILTKVE